MVGLGVGVSFRVDFLESRKMLDRIQMAENFEELMGGVPALEGLVLTQPEEPPTEAKPSKKNGTPVPPPGGSLPLKQVELSSIGKLILAVDAGLNPSDENYDESFVEARVTLATRLGCQPEDLDAIVESYGDLWDALVLEERVRKGLDSDAMKDASWDRLEAAVLRKLNRLVDMDRITSVGEYLAIAKVANQANRGTGRMGKGNPPGTPGAQVNIGFYPGDPDRGVLPSGNLGTMKLTLSHRIQKQIEGTAVRDGHTLSDLEMLSLNDLQQADDKRVKEEAENENGR